MENVIWFSDLFIEEDLCKIILKQIQLNIKHGDELNLDEHASDHYL